MARSYVYHIISGVNECYVCATELTINRRRYTYNSQRFVVGIYDYADNYPKKDADVNGNPILSVRQFDKWLKQHNL